MTSESAEPGGPVPAWARWLLPAGALALVAGMAITVLGIPIAPLFRPGTWLILLAMLLLAAGSIARVVAATTAAGDGG
jgi:hypothetical protein